jgi:hypothetical protein
MKIIRDNTRLATVTCKHCQSILELQPSDVKGGDVTNHYFECLCCKQVNYILLQSFSKSFVEEIEK